MEYFSINPNNINTFKSIYVSDDNKELLTRVLASSLSNKLEELDLSGCSNLKGILPVTKCHKLKKVNISKTQIKSIKSLNKCLLLEELIIDNYIFYDIQNFLNLVKIEINCNVGGIKYYTGEVIKVNNLPKLEIVKIYNKSCSKTYNLNKLVRNIFNQTTIKELYIEHMSISINDFNNLINLNKLKLININLDLLNTNTHAIHLLNLEKLVLIDCFDKNKIIKIFHNSINIKYLAISYIIITCNYNKINNIDDILYLTNLEELHLDNTNIIFTQEIFDKLNTLEKLKKVYIYSELPENKINFIPTNINYEFTNNYHNT